MNNLVLLGLIFIVFLAVCIQQNNPKEATTIGTQAVPNKTNQTQQSNIQKSNLSLIINIPQKINVGEFMSGKYEIESVNPFQAYIITGYRKEGSEKPEDNDVNGGVLALWKANISINKIFHSPGNYVYELEVYNCSQIENILRVNCSSKIDYNIVKEKVPLLGSATKTITVT